MAEINIGDVVMLRSSSPRMTVKAIEKDLVTCVWFDKRKVMEGKFLLVNLVKYDAKNSFRTIKFRF